MSIWAGKQTQAALSAVSNGYALNKQRSIGANVDTVQINVIAGLEKLISTVNTLNSVKPELTLASKILLECKAQINKAILSHVPQLHQDESLESERPSFKM